MRPAYCCWSLAAVAFSALLAHGAEPFAGTPAAAADLRVSVAPEAVALQPGQRSVKVVYTFTNQTAAALKVQDRYEHIETIPSSWQSSRMRPFPTPLDIPPRGMVCWSNDACLGQDDIDRALEDGLWQTGKLVLVETFSIVANQRAVTNVTAKVTFGLSYRACDPTNFSTASYDVTALRAFTDDPDKRARLMRLLDFADRAPGALSNVLGICPGLEKKIPLLINSFEGICHYSPSPEPHLSMPWSWVDQQGGIGGLFWVYPHELAHYFLMSRFPNSPKWFIEGPASFFGNKVAKALGQERSAAYHHQQLLDLAQNYSQNRSTYCFEALWPEDEGKNDNPVFNHSCGFGYAYQICLELEQLCGQDFFPKALHHMDQTGLDFAKAPTEREKNRLLIEALQFVTRQDLRKFFAEKGFK